MIITRERAVERYGSDYRIAKELEAGRLHRVAHGYYSDRRHEDPYALAALRYPGATVTMDSAFFLHGLTDVIPERVHLATSRSATRISDPAVVQHFSEDRLLEAGRTHIERDGAHIPIYSRERMLVELMRRSRSMPLDYYREIMGSYRRIADELDIREIEDLIGLYERSGFMFDILQREVL